MALLAAMCFTMATRPAAADSPPKSRPTPPVLVPGQPPPPAAPQAAPKDDPEDGPLPFDVLRDMSQKEIDELVAKAFGAGSAETRRPVRIIPHGLGLVVAAKTATLSADARSVTLVQDYERDHFIRPIHHGKPRLSQFLARFHPN